MSLAFESAFKGYHLMIYMRGYPSFTAMNDTVCNVCSHRSAVMRECVKNDSNCFLGHNCHKSVSKTA